MVSFIAYILAQSSLNFNWIHLLTDLLYNKVMFLKQKTIPQGLQIPVPWIYYSVFVYYAVGLTNIPLKDLYFLSRFLLS